MTPLVSITMSTYNVENFIEESLECIVNQTLKDLEIICIDDGSTDGTLHILNHYAAKDKRIQIVAKVKNEGLAVARNEALALAKGKYICFVDGDDLMDLDLFRKASKLAEDKKSDLVLWDYVTFWNKNEISAKKKIPSKLSNLTISDKTVLLQRPAFTWVKLIKTEVAKSLSIYFPKGLTRQDIPVHWHLITSISKIVVLPERLSYYRQQPKATTHSKDARLFDLATVMDITKEYLIKADLYDLYKNEFLRQRLNLLFGMYDIIDPSLKNKALSKIKERLGIDEDLYIKSSKPLRWQASVFYVSLKGSLIATFKFKAWLLTRHLYRLLN